MRGLISEDEKTKDDQVSIFTDQSDSSDDANDFSKYVDRMENSKTKRLKVEISVHDLEISKFKKEFLNN